MNIRKKEKNPLSSDFKIPLLRTYIKEEQKVLEQKALKAEYNIKEEDIVVVEKKNAIAQILRTIFNTAFTITKIVLNTLLVTLATIGLASIVYPNIREELIKTALAIFLEMRGYFN